MSTDKFGDYPDKLTDTDDFGSVDKFDDYDDFDDYNNFNDFSGSGFSDSDFSDFSDSGLDSYRDYDDDSFSLTKEDEAPLTSGSPSADDRWQYEDEPALDSGGDTRPVRPTSLPAMTCTMSPRFSFVF